MVNKSSPLADTLSQPLFSISKEDRAKELAEAAIVYAERIRQEDTTNATLDNRSSTQRSHINRVFRNGEPIVDRFSFTEI